MTDEARLEQVESGLTPATDGWFAVNVRDAAWLTRDAFGARCAFETAGPLVRERPELEVRRFLVPGRTGERSIVYPVSRLALRHGAGVETETDSAFEAYAPYPHWQPGHPDGWDRLPWAEAESS